VRPITLTSRTPCEIPTPSEARRGIIREYVTTTRHRAAARKRGNPCLGQALPLGPAVPTEFELQVRRLHLTRETYVFSSKLRQWCQENRNRFYIPEWLLDE
jgi:hypothetical protein